jgi:hypothetical protein
MRKIYVLIAIFFMAITVFYSCNKLDDIIGDGNGGSGHMFSKPTKSYSSEVAFKWIDMQLHLILTNPTPFGGTPTQRYFSYGAIALYESVVPGMPDYRSLSGQLNNFPTLPQPLHGYTYSWAICANTAMAAMTRSFFTLATDVNKTKIDSLENALNDWYKMQTDTATFSRSVTFGKAVVELVFNWAKADGASEANAPYTPPVGKGLWKPTPPAFAPAAVPYWGNNRLMVASSLDGIELKAPPVYSEDPNSEYYKMMKDVYDASLTITDEQKAVAIFYGGKPGTQGYGGAGYLSSIKAVLVQENPKLDFTAYAFAKASIAMNDAGIACYKLKYQYNQQRPVTYIREVLGDTLWTSFIPTPPFPDFPSAHASHSGAYAEIMEGLLGMHYHFTDSTYNFQGQSPRVYTSFDDMVKEINDARFYGGIHSRFSNLAGAELGRKVANNIEKTLKFKKW